MLKALFALLCIGCSSTDTVRRMDKHTVLIVGQSNIQARFDRDYIPHNNVRILKDGKFIHASIKGSYVNEVFDKLIDDNTTGEVDYVNIAFGGSSSYRWREHGDLFPEIQELAYLPIDTVIYHQGENDTALGTTRKEYRDNLQSLVDGINYLFPDVTIYVSIVSYRDGGKTSDAITSAQYDIISNNDNVRVGIYADDLVEREDGIHFSGISISRAVSRYVKVLWK